MVDVSMESDEREWRARLGSPEHEGLDFASLSQQAREAAGRTRDWIVANPFAALGIAVGTGFLVGRTMRMWVLRP